MLWTPLLMFLTRAGSRNAFDQCRNSGQAPSNMGSFCGQTEQDPRFEGQPLITCSDNVAHHLRRVPAKALEGFPADLCQLLHQRRVFDQARVLGHWYVLVFDGTVQELCREGFEEGGKSGGSGGKRYRYVLQCGLLGPGHTFFPLLHEHADMDNIETEKEDCELAAFGRLAGRVKKRFPRMPFCVVGDALYAVQPVVKLCESHGWKYVLTLKEGRQPLLWEEVVSLLPLSPENVLRVRHGQDDQKGLRDFRWVDDLLLAAHRTTAVLIGEITESAATLYAYVTNFRVNKDRVLDILPPTGRERHHIEDYFNAGKNHGIGLGHVFCANANASKNFFTLMQIAGILWTIICRAYLVRVFDWAARASETSLARALGEGLRSCRFPARLPQPGQLRFVT